MSSRNYEADGYNHDLDYLLSRTDYVSHILRGVVDQE